MPQQNGQFQLDDSGQLRWVPSGQPPVPGMGLAQPPNLPPQDPNAPFGVTPEEFPRALGITLGKTAELMSGLVPASWPVRSALAMGAGLPTGALLDEENPLRGAAKEAALQGGLEGMSSMVASKAPEWFSRIGLKMGSVGRGRATDPDKVIESLLRLRDRGFGKGVPFGQTKRTGQMIRQEGQNLAAEESSLPGTVDLRQARGAIHRQGGVNNLYERQQNSSLPITNRSAIENEEARILGEQIASRRRQVTTPQPTGPVPQTVNINIPRSPEPGTALERSEFQRRGVALRRSGPGDGEIVEGEVVPPQTLTAQTQDAANPFLSIRESGELSRGLRQEHGVDELIRMRQAGQFVPPGEDLKAQVRDAISREIKALQEEAIRLAGGDPTRLQQINRTISDLKRVQDANTHMRGQGMSWGDLGQMGMRGGLGAGVGSALATTTGGDYGTGAAMGGLGGLLLLSPANLSRLGFWSGRLGGGFPTIYRGTDLTTDVKNKDISRRVRRREPK